MFRKLGAIKLGRLPKLDRYSVVARFGCESESQTSFLPVAGFTIFDKDKFRYALIIALITVLTAAFIALVLRVFGIQW